MTEDQIEFQVERATDRLDKRFMAGEITEAQYREECYAISDWADKQYYALSDRGTYKLSRDET